MPRRLSAEAALDALAAGRTMKEISDDVGYRGQPHQSWPVSRVLREERRRRGLRTVYQLVAQHAVRRFKEGNDGT